MYISCYIDYNQKHKGVRLINLDMIAEIHITPVLGNSHVMAQNFARFGAAQGEIVLANFKDKNSAQQFMTTLSQAMNNGIQCLNGIELEKQIKAQNPKEQEGVHNITGTPLTPSVAFDKSQLDCQTPER